MHPKRVRECVGGFFALILVLIPSAAYAQESVASASNRGFTAVNEIFQTSCAGCHDWTGSYDSLVSDGKIVAGSPEQSLIYQKIADDSMPQAGDKLTTAQKALIRAWILADAPKSDQPIAVGEAAAAASPAPATPAAGSPAAVAAAPTPGRSFLLFPNKVAFHKTTGFTATALFLGAGILGVVHFVDMMSAGHTLRDQVGFQEGGPESQRIPLVQDAWAGDSTLRWMHVGFVAGGEVLYLGDAITGLSMLSRHKPGKITKSDIHRWAFFTHATLMAAQVALGFLETSALQQGSHDTTVALGAAHAGIGLAIPLVMLGAGLENIFLKE